MRTHKKMQRRQLVKKIGMAALGTTITMAAQLGLAVLGMAVFGACAHGVSDAADVEPLTSVGVPRALEQASADLTSEEPVISEAAACEALLGALAARAGELRCQEEIGSCPGALRTGWGSACSLYKESSVRTCEAQYASAKSCGDLAAVGICGAARIAGSSPAGCIVPLP